ncbi:MAG: protein-export chaperone SecB [Gammaproteobacteria bacterium]|nr:protein-export chaperone SecB [Gammaproteobacteria bacterium]MCY4217667.1 protein-export chaperone SecB [Gammaproteobacteria bacterium]MCY4275724.1 protein-export chaperone SecB [Gammaproteobacteria bacterium]
MNDSNQNDQSAGSQTTPSNSTDSSRFELLSIYTKDISFEAPSLPQILINRPSEIPNNRVDFRVDHKVINPEQGLTEIRFGVTVTCTLNDQTLYLAEVEQCGLFLIKHSDPNTIEKTRDVACPNILLPFAREQIAGLISKGNFPPFLIAPINFEQTYEEKLKKQAQQSKESDQDFQS